MNRKAKTSAPSQRMLRVGELVRHALSAFLVRGEVQDPALEGAMITVPEVRMTPDLKLANVYIMPLGGENAEQVVEALNRHKKYVRGGISSQLSLKYAPSLRFFVDDTFAEADRINALLRSKEVSQDLTSD
ncbi:MAG: 30S ribosome-binding factor RbfA [Devosiaceae bacterium]|nr:30S ribosome-binding factor RbfA [Devosiaceae bacterium]